MKKIGLAVDLGASFLRVALVSPNGRILKKIKTPTPRQGEAETIAKKIIFLAEKILQNGDKNLLSGIAIVSAGPLDSQKGELITPTNLSFKKVILKHPLEKYFGQPVLLANDASAAALGEKVFGKGKKYRHLVFITISTGIGGGAIVDNHLLCGKKGNAAEIGCFNLETNYKPTYCPPEKQTHWESYASGKNLPKFFHYWLSLNKTKREKNYHLKTAKEIFELARKKDKTALLFIEEIGKINSRGVFNVIAAYEPEIILMGGPVCLKNKSFIIPVLKKYLDKSLPLPQIVPASLGENASLAGAAALLFSVKEKSCSRVLLD